MSNIWNGSRVWGTVLSLGLVGIAMTFLVAMSEESRHSDNPTPIFGMVVAAVIFGVVLRGPLGRAVGKMLEGPAQHDDVLRDRIEDLEMRVGDFGSEQQRILELEERLDFAERLLAQRDPQALPRGRE